MTIIPCERNDDLRKKIRDFAEVLKTESHKLGTHGLSEQEFYNSGLFRGAIERVRGQFAATMQEKRDFASQVLQHMQVNGHISSWTSVGQANRHDYSVTMPSGRIAAIELKGCLDGNNTNIFERPPQAQEFILWSVCLNAGADPRLNARSGIHSRLSAEIVSRNQRVDGLLIWDLVCGTVGRLCPKLALDPSRTTDVGPFALPPPCIYVFPATVPSVRNNPRPPSQGIRDVQILNAFHQCFGGRDNELNFVDIEVANRGAEVVRTTRIHRGGSEVHASMADAIQRS
jgi:hypothetical protein